jgi:hypothetical protein
MRNISNKSIENQNIFDGMFNTLPPPHKKFVAFLR